MRIRSAVILLSLVTAGVASAATPTEAENTLRVFEQKDPSIQRFVQGSVGYVVFPSVGKGGFIAGGAHGSGVLFVRGQPVGEASMTQINVGLQVGGESYSQIIFFEDKQTLESFKEGHFALAAGASAVALSAGAAENAEYSKGVAIFTASRSGLMLEASIGGQKFSFEPYRHNVAGHNKHR
jgi:lipid-binding SYLF domain-containing protein